ncbi:unnamed protein product, partial [Amoebophrya sp. A25]|eukprot:GSA25T00005177001.1
MQLDACRRYAEPSSTGLVLGLKFSFWDEWTAGFYDYWHQWDRVSEIDLVVPSFFTAFRVEAALFERDARTGALTLNAANEEICDDVSTLPDGEHGAGGASRHQDDVGTRTLLGKEHATRNASDYDDNSGSRGLVLFEKEEGAGQHKANGFASSSQAQNGFNAP